MFFVPPLVSVPVRGFETEEQFENYVKNDSTSGNLLAAVVFEHPFTHDDEPLPLKVRKPECAPSFSDAHGGRCAALSPNSGTGVFPPKLQ